MAAGSGVVVNTIAPILLSSDQVEHILATQGPILISSIIFTVSDVSDSSHASFVIDFEEPIILIAVLEASSLLSVSDFSLRHLPAIIIH